MATQLNDFYRGDTKNIKVTISQAGVPIDITGATLIFTMRESPTTAIILQKTAILTNPTLGEATFFLTPLDTDLAVKSYVYDIQFTDSSGNVSTIIATDIKVLQDITQ